MLNLQRGDKNIRGAESKSRQAELSPVADYSALNRSIQIRKTVKLQKIPAKYIARYKKRRLKYATSNHTGENRLRQFVSL
ncbi:hypothetical protein [Collimonas sp. OK242]|jgi:hypothetical protein|uniref:hypothetical protein n=1 Tax=Collimonas sp. OK242 TaxID=1798195 RepID=UPI00115FD779|nr:hypothetical protein [Collimonas sp. OK242]